MIFKEKEFMSGLTEENTRGTGLPIKCMDKAALCGVMENYTRDNILMVKKKDTVIFNGVTVNYIKEIGKMDYNTGKE